MPIKSSHSTLPIPIWMILIGKDIHCSASFCCGKEKQSCLSVIHHGTDTVEWQAYLSVQASQASPSVCQTSHAATLQNAAHCTLPVTPCNALPRLACAVSLGLSASQCAISLFLQRRHNHKPGVSPQSSHGGNHQQQWRLQNMGETRRAQGRQRGSLALSVCWQSYRSHHFCITIRCCSQLRHQLFQMKTPSVS